MSRKEAVNQSVYLSLAAMKGALPIGWVFQFGCAAFFDDCETSDPTPTS